MNATISSAGPHCQRRDLAAPEGRLTRPLADLYTPIVDDLAMTEQLMRQTLTAPSDFINELVQRVQLYGGKRLRPALLLLSARACGRVSPAHHTLAAVVELIHVATLVHDDVLDDATLRRHVATVNAEWGTEPSLLLGDLLFTHAFQLAASVESIDACRLLAKATNAICSGELHQVSRRGCFELSEVEYLSMLAGKTAELLSCACRLGAAYAGAPAPCVEALAEYGRKLGIAFQIADDVLDLLGEEATIGKTIGSDLRKQKMTLPLIRLRATASASRVAELRRLFEHPNPAQRQAVVKLLTGTDALPYTVARGRQFVEDALGALRDVPASPARTSLADMARFALERAA